jgi:MFS family permease
VIPNITGSNEETLVANGLSSTTWSFNLAIGAAIGGLLAAAFGRNFVLIVNSISFIVSGLLLRRMHLREPHLECLPPLRVGELFDFSPIAEGIRYVRRDPRLLATLFVKAGLGFMGANWVLLPIFGERIYPVSIGSLDPKSAGMLGMSLLMGCRGIGALLGPIVAARWSGHDEERFRQGIIAGFVIGGIGYLTLGFSGSLLGACAAVVIAHSGGSTCWVFSTTLLHLHTDDRFRGRVFAAEFAFNMLTMSASTYAAGLLADAGLSVYTLSQFTGLLVLIPGVAWAFAQRLWRDEAKVAA